MYGGRVLRCDQVRQRLSRLLNRLHQPDLSTLQVAARLPDFDGASTPVQPPVEPSSQSPAEALT